ncbi:MAG TPA: RNA-binding S4 domain-containing protein [Stellaceae bacterium]|nr:RNA-binding S4 domain-containing protein [Stellaceae bacterium]
MNHAAAPPEPPSLRIDKWLWHARLAKTRGLAGRLVDAGAVSLRDNPVRRAAQSVRVGDVLVVTQGARRRTLTILALGIRRGPAIEARTLYSETGTAEGTAEPWVSLLADIE